MSEVIHRLDVELKSVRRSISEQRRKILHLKGQVDALKHAKEVLDSDKAGTIDDLQSHSEKVTELLRQWRRALKEAKDRLESLEGELEGYLKVREIIGGGSEEITADVDIEVRREISNDWRQILGHILKIAPNPVSIDDIMLFVQKNGMMISRNAVRSQLHNYSSRGFLKRVSEGHYRATDAIKRLC